MKKKVKIQVKQVFLPFRHTVMPRWEVILKNEDGRKMIQDWHYESKEEALSAASVWEKTHPGWEVEYISGNN